MEEQTKSGDTEGAEPLATENKACIFLKCPKCKKGYLLPFSRGEDVFEKWKCSECGYTIEKR